MSAEFDATQLSHVSERLALWMTRVLLSGEIVIRSLLTTGLSDKYHSILVALVLQLAPMASKSSTAELVLTVRTGVVKRSGGKAGKENKLEKN